MGLNETYYAEGVTTLSKVQNLFHVIINNLEHYDTATITGSVLVKNGNVTANLNIEDLQLQVTLNQKEQH